MKDSLIIVFTKNGESGKVKTRLAHDIGDENALIVFNVLLNHTKSVLQRILKDGISDVEIHLSQSIDDPQWNNFTQRIQAAGDLGTKMKTAFRHGFDNGYKQIIGIGTDLPELEVNHITKALKALSDNDIVLGPSHDGGYYLIGMNQLYDQLFNDIDWSTEHVLTQTLERAAGKKTELLQEENDIDTFSDLLNSPGIQKMYNEVLNKINNTHPY